jgi:hypothetical protein
MYWIYLIVYSKWLRHLLIPPRRYVLCSEVCGVGLKSVLNFIPCDAANFCSCLTITFDLKYLMNINCVYHRVCLLSLPANVVHTFGAVNHIADNVI